MSKKVFIIACEPSGDRHAAELLHSLKRSVPDLDSYGLGGPQMERAGTRLIHDMTLISALGFGDVLRQYFKYRRIFNRALRAFKEYKPDVVVLIDSPAFNLRFAKKILQHVPVVYYVSPQLWAWGKRRIHTVRKTVTKMLAILPFEKAFYDEAGVDCAFVGHPLLDEIRISDSRDALRSKFDMGKDKTAIGLLPGSRKREVTRILPIMLESAKYLSARLPNALFFITPSANVDSAIYDSILAKYPEVKVRKCLEDRHDLVHALDFALVTSGTATLETALLGTPFFLLYKTSWSTYMLGKSLIRVPFLGLVNLLASKKVVPEFIQDDACPRTIAHEAEVLLKNRSLYQSMKDEFTRVRHILGDQGASDRAAREIMKFLPNQNVPTETRDKEPARS
ncbi:MAG: lipid-A-disaccharide synthase [Candidatus Omnitrophota bacterium]|nr:lipid-A-disaccharide synthase [Candidatus Omnitrophota bacterium]